MFDWATGRDIEPKPEPTLSWEDAADEREDEMDRRLKEVRERANKRKVRALASSQAEKKSKEEEIEVEAQAVFERLKLKRLKPEPPA